MQAINFGAHANVPRRNTGTDDDLSEISVGNNSFSCHK